MIQAVFLTIVSGGNRKTWRIFRILDTGVSLFENAKTLTRYIFFRRGHTGFP